MTSAMSEQTAFAEGSLALQAMDAMAQEAFQIGYRRALADHHCNTGGDSINPLRVGDLLHKHSGGLFNRDFWACVRVEGVGADWVVARIVDGYDEGKTVTAAGSDVVAAAEALRRPDPNCGCDQNV